MAAVEVRVPPVLRKFTTGASSIRVEGATVSDLLNAIEDQYTGFRTEIVGPDGQLHRFINIYRNGEDIRYLQKEATALKDGDNISIVPSIAGGAA